MQKIGVDFPAKLWYVCLLPSRWEHHDEILERQQRDSAANRRIRDAVDVLIAGSAAIEEWDESVIRQLVDTVKVLSVDRIRVYLRGGMEIEQTIEGQ